jgi:hypothetical protein
MATQLDEAPQVEQTDAPRDYEAEAREHGWTGQDEFKGDPNRWIDAETFVKRADEVMPLLKKQNDTLKRELASLKKDVARASEHFTKAEERAYDRAVADVTAKMNMAVEAGDHAAASAAMKERLDLDKGVIDDAPAPQADPLDVQEALIDFRDANPWYDEGGVARDYADVMAEKHKAKTADMPPAEFFAFIAGKVKERYPDLEKPKAERKRPGMMVEGGGQRVVSRGRSFSDLPPQAQQLADKWIKSGLIKDRAAYVSSYQW